jgi:hypothetical protein
MKRLVFSVVMISFLFGLITPAKAVTLDGFAQSRGMGEKAQTTTVEIYLTEPAKDVGDIGYHLIAISTVGTQKFAFGGGPFLRPFGEFSIIPFALARFDLHEDNAYAGTALGAKMFWAATDHFTAFLGTTWNIMEGKPSNFFFANPRLSWWVLDFTETISLGIIEDGSITVNSEGNSTIGLGLPGIGVGSRKSSVGIRLAPLYEAGNQPKNQDRWSVLFTVYLTEQLK